MGKFVTILTLFGIKGLEEIDFIVERLDAGLDVNSVDSGGRTLLMEAAVHGKHELMKLLLDRGANACIKEERNWDALHFAVQNVDLLAAEMLVEAGADVNSTDDNGNSVISRAVFSFRGDGNVIKFLITNGADVNKKNKSGISALSLAESISNYNIVPFLSN